MSLAVCCKKLNRYCTMLTLIVRCESSYSGQTGLLVWLRAKRLMTPLLRISVSSEFMKMSFPVGRMGVQEGGVICSP